MAISCPVGFDTQRLRDEVAKMYSRVAKNPEGDYHFHRGPLYASEQLGYESSELSALPPESTASFAGVGNPLSVGSVEQGQTVVDIGCGAGMDLLLAATHVGASGRAIGIDMTPEMLSRTRESAAAMGLDQVDLRQGDAEEIPVESASVDVVISNGVINLTTDKSRAYSEILRILRPGGELFLSDIVVASELSDAVRNDIDLWAS
jgi:SAM-dependent methyltransferase